MNRRFGRPQLPSLLDRSGGYGGSPYDRRGGFGENNMSYGSFQDEKRFERYAEELLEGGGCFGFGIGGGGGNGPSPASYRSKFSDRSGGDSSLPPEKEEILKDLGQTLYDSLKEGRNLAKDPSVRKKIVSLMKSEEKSESTVVGGTAKKAPLSTGTGNPYSKYDAFYEDPVSSKMLGSSVGGGGFGSKKSRPGIGYEDSARSGFRNGSGFGSDSARMGFGNSFARSGFGDREFWSSGFGYDPRSGFDGPRPGYGYYDDPHVSLTGGTSKLSQRFARVVNNEADTHRIWASERELLVFFRDSPTILERSLRNRLKNTISYELSRETNPKRTNWLNVQYNLLVRTKIFGKRVEPSKNTKDGMDKPVVPHKRKYSARKLEIKRLRDKRPPQAENERYMTNYLKSLLFELCEDTNRVHAVLILRSITQNPRMIQCLQKEVIELLNEKFGSAPNLSMEAANSKRKFIMDHMKKYLAETKTHLLTIKKTTKFIFEREALFESIQPLLLGKEEPKEPFSIDDYIMEPEKTEADFINDYKYLFVRFAFEKFFFKVVEAFITTKNIEKRINFFMNNGFIAGLIVDAVKLKASPLSLPPMAKKYVTNMDPPCQETSAKVDEEIFKKALEKNEVINTNVSDYVANTSLVSPEVLHYFKNCITYFDVKLSVLKFQLIDYTNYVRLSRDYKLYVFNEIIKFVYAQVLELLVNNVDVAAKEYFEMEKDE